MDLVIEKIRKIQNKCKTLKWGYHQPSDSEVMFVVGNIAYFGQYHFFIINDNYNIYFITDEHKRELYKNCVDESDVIASVIVLLKEWFPAK